MEKPVLTDVLRRSHRIHVLNSQRQSVKIFKRICKLGKPPDLGLHREIKFLFTQAITISSYRRDRLIQRSTMPSLF